MTQADAALEAFERDHQSWPPPEDTLRCPFGYLATVREQSPVYRFPQVGPEGVVTYLVTGWKECAEVLVNARAFKNNLEGLGLGTGDDSVMPAPVPGAATFYNDENVFFADGDDHKVKRSWVLRFTDREHIESYRPVVEFEVDRMIDSFIADGHCDFRKQFSDVMPMFVVRRVMGLPDEADPMIKRMSAAIAAVDNNPASTPEQMTEVGDASGDLLLLCADLVQRRNADPIEDDFVSELVEMQVGRDGVLDVNTLAKHLVVTIFGADHAMGGHLADLASRLGRDSRLQERVRADRSLVRQFMLESLRIESGLPWLFRKCVEDTTVGGVEIPAGSVVLVVSVAGNHDPEEFPAPETFDIERTNLGRNHLTLGRGVHRCAGAAMATLQAEVTVNRLLDRLCDIRLDEERSDLLPEPGASFGFRVPTAVHLTFTAAD